MQLVIDNMLYNHHKIQFWSSYLQHDIMNKSNDPFNKDVKLKT